MGGERCASVVELVSGRLWSLVDYESGTPEAVKKEVSFPMRLVKIEVTQIHYLPSHVIGDGCLFTLTDAFLYI